MAMDHFAKAERVISFAATATNSTVMTVSMEIECGAAALWYVA